VTCDCDCDQFHIKTKILLINSFNHQQLNTAINCSSPITKLPNTNTNNATEMKGNERRTMQPTQQRQQQQVNPENHPTFINASLIFSAIQDTRQTQNEQQRGGLQ